MSPQLILAGGALAVFGALAMALRELLAGDEALDPGVEAPPVEPFLTRWSGAIERALVERGWQTSLARSLDGAGVAMRPGQLCLVVAALAVAVGLVGTTSAGAAVGLCGMALTPLIAVGFLRSRRTRRQQAFAAQIVQVLPSLASSLRAGHSFIQAVELAADELDDPAGGELRRVAAEINLGRDQIEALRGMADRYECEDLRWMVGAVEIHREVGGDLTLVLERVTETIRARDRLQREVQTLTAEGRASAKVLGALPLVAGVLMSLINRRTVAAFTGSSGGMALAGLAVVLMAAGWLWLRILTKVEV